MGAQKNTHDFGASYFFLIWMYSHNFLFRVCLLYFWLSLTLYWVQTNKKWSMSHFTHDLAQPSVKQDQVLFLELLKHQINSQIIRRKEWWKNDWNLSVGVSPVLFCLGLAQKYQRMCNQFVKKNAKKVKICLAMSRETLTNFKTFWNLTSKLCNEIFENTKSHQNLILF